MTDKINKFFGKKLTKSRIIIGIAVIVVLFCSIWIVRALPKKDRIVCDELPKEKFVYAEDNYYAYQSGSDCSGYATAYVLRNIGKEAEGAELYKEFNTVFGHVALHNIVDRLKDYGVKAYAYHGDIETLKCRLNQGKPVIALVTIKLNSPNGLHYIAVVGYDEEYIYIADSSRPYTNTRDKQQYNRKLSYERFEEIWDTSIYPTNNVYIVIE